MAGIDQLVSQTADAYRGNPQGLEQKYQAGQQLFDLLALQRLKSEKEAAARDIQMKMQQNPATIKQQREQELMQLTKDEMLQRVGPTLNRKMQQQQVAAQQAPQQAQQQAQQAQQGIAALQQQMQQRPQAQPQRLARGGIVQNFQEGKQVISPERQKELDELNEFGSGISSLFTPKYAPSEKLEELRGMGVDVPKYVAPEVADRLLAKAKEEGRTLQPKLTSDAMLNEDAVDSISKVVEAEQRGAEEPKVRSEGDTVQGLKDLGTSSEQYLGVNGKPIVEPDANEYLASMRKVGDVSAEDVSMDEVIADSTKMANYLGIDTTTPADAKKAREETYKRHLKDMRYNDIMSEKDKIAKRREQRYLDSQERSTVDILADFMIGFGGATTIGAGFQGATANLKRSMANAQQREDMALEAYDEALNDSLATQQEINSAAVNAAEASYNRTLQQRIAEQQMKSSIMNTTQATKQGDARNKLSADIANAEREQKLLTEKYKGDLRKYVADIEAKIRQDSPAEVANSLINMLGSVESYEAAIRTQIMSTPEFMQQQAVILDEDSDETEVADAKERQAQLISSAMSTPTLSMIRAIAMDMFKKANYGDPKDYMKNNDYADAAGEDDKPSYAR